MDQALLLGPARRVYAHLERIELDDGITDCGFTMAITHTSGVRSHLTSSKLSRIQARELRAYGSAGSCAARGTDVQTQAIFSGLRPYDLGAAWGHEAEHLWAR